MWHDVHLEPSNEGGSEVVNHPSTAGTDVVDIAGSSGEADLTVCQVEPPVSRTRDERGEAARDWRSAIGGSVVLPDPG